MRSRRGRAGTIVAGVLRVLVVLAVVSVVVLDPLTSTSQTTDSASVRSYDVAMSLSEDGALDSLERVVVQMPPGKRGIFRIFDTADPRRSGVEHPVEVESVERDGEAEPYVDVSSAAGTRSIRIGDEDVYLDAGDHTYTIRSRTVDALEAGRPGETQWWWDVVGAGWQMSMDQVSVTARLPARPLRVECVQGEDTPCTATVDGTTLQLRTGPLAPFTPVTLRVAFDADDVGAPATAGTPWVTLVLSAIAVLAAALLGGWCWRRTREREPGFPVVFEPPFLVPPALGVRVLDERDAAADLQATLFDLGERGVLRLQGDDDSWTVEVVQTLDDELLHPIERTLLEGLGLRSVGDVFVVSETEDSGRVVGAARSAVRAQVAESSAAYLQGSGPGALAIGLGWLCLIATFVLAGVHLFSTSGWVSWPLLAGTATFAVVVMGMLFEPGVRTTRTAEGRDLWSRTGGFARFLTTDSSEARFDAAAHLDWYPRYLAWAVALGVGDEWARRYQAQGVDVPAVPWLLWSGTGTAHLSADSMNRSFDSAIASASAAYAASQASSSSGGGFSGGSGGGGGGGGSW
jgi:uncharacterized membrane protein YgcG